MGMEPHLSTKKPFPVSLFSLQRGQKTHIAVKNNSFTCSWNDRPGTQEQIPEEINLARCHHPVIHPIIINMDRGNHTSDFNSTPFSRSKHPLILLSPTWIVEEHCNGEVGSAVKPIVWIWEGGEIEITFGTRKHNAADVDCGGQVRGDNAFCENFCSASVSANHLELRSDVNS